EAPFDVRCVITEFQPAAPPHTFLDEDFEGDGTPTYVELGWTTVEAGDPTADHWKLCNGTSTPAPNGFDHGSWQNEVDSDAGGSVDHDERLITPSMSFAGYTSDIHLKFWNDYNWYSSDIGYVNISLDDGISWPITVATYSSDVADKWEDFDISTHVAGETTVKIMWQYMGSYDYRWDMDDVLIDYSPSFTEVEVYNQTNTTTGIIPVDGTQQLTWDYDFTNESQYRITVTTELSTDENAGNDGKEALVTIVLPPVDDVLVQSIDSHVDLGTYPAGLQSVTATVENMGSGSQGPFNVNCLIKRFDVPPVNDVVITEDFTCASNDFALLASGVWTTESYAAGSD
ncbi:MAG: hypothetical protein KAT70_08360, partial [Thermoplasmata archaeon]|nr:hypothetical protein [Thermoplasmata archaeon]